MLKDKERDTSMDLLANAWDLHRSLWHLRKSLIDNNEVELAAELEDPIRSFWFYSLFSNGSTLLTVAGPQGVGKSLMVNTLFELPKETGLPVGEERCERIPVVLTHIDKNDPKLEEATWKPVVVYKKTDPEETQFHIVETMSYEEGRERAINPRDDDAVIFWYVVDNPLLSRLSPIAVLPGLELEAPWAKAIKFILDVSDVVIYALDDARVAQETAEQMEKWIKKTKLAVKPITVVTKYGTIASTEKQRDLTNTLAESGFSPIFIDSYSQVKGGKMGYEELWKAITTSLINIPHGLQTEKLSYILKEKVIPVLEKVRDVAKEEENYISLEENRLITAVLDRLDQLWKNVVRQKLLNEADAVVAKRADRAMEEARNIAEEEFRGMRNKIKIWFTGGPNVSSIAEIESEIKDQFFSGLNKKLSTSFEKTLSSRIKPIPKEPIAGDDWTANALIAIMTAPPREMLNTTDDLIKSFVEAGKLGDSMFVFLKSSVNNAGAFAEEIKKYSEIIRSLRGGATGIALSGGIGTGGAVSAGLEATGLGVAGVTASTIVGLIGASLALISGLALFSSILRSSRKMEWEVERYTRELVSENHRRILENIEQGLDRFWDAFKFVIKEDMMWRMGLDDSLIKAITLYECLKDAQDTARKVIIKIGI